MEIANALILAGRTAHDEPWPSVRSGPKHLVPVANRPILFHNLESLRRAGLIEATIAVDHEHAEPIIAAVGNGSKWGLTVRYVDWHSASGVEGALAAAQDFVADEPLLVEPADVLHCDLIHPHIAAFAREALDAMALRVPLMRGPSRAAVGGYLFSQRAVSMLLDGAWAGDPFTGIQQRGGHVRDQTIDGCLPCHGGQDQLLEGNRRALEYMPERPSTPAPANCEFQGRVLVHPSARVEHTLIRGPVVVGPGTCLSHAYVGPYTSIGSDVKIEGSQIEHSIVLDGAELMHIGAAPRLECRRSRRTGAQDVHTDAVAPPLRRGGRGGAAPVTVAG